MKAGNIFNSPSTCHRYTTPAETQIVAFHQNKDRKPLSAFFSSICIPLKLDKRTVSVNTIQRSANGCVLPSCFRAIDDSVAKPRVSAAALVCVVVSAAAAAAVVCIYYDSIRTPTTESSAFTDWPSSTVAYGSKTGHYILQFAANRSWRRDDVALGYRTITADWTALCSHPRRTRYRDLDGILKIARTKNLPADRRYVLCCCKVNVST